MAYENVLGFIDGSIWACTPQMASDIKRFAEGISAGELARMRSEFDAGVEAGIYDDPVKRSGTRKEGSTAIVPIRGVMAKRANLMTRMSGGTSTELLRSTFQALAEDDDVKRVVVDIDSGGGSVQGVAEAANALRELSAKKETVAVANDMMASAAYWVGSAARKVYVTPSSTVGSIGVLAMVTDQSEALEEKGIKVHVVRSAEFKALSNGSEPITKKALKEIEKGVNYYHSEFVGAISSNLNISQEQAEEMANGKVHEARQAIEAGLADDEVTLDEVLLSFDSMEDTEAKLAQAENIIAAYQSHTDDLEADLEAKKEKIELLREQNQALQSRDAEREAEAVVDAAIEKGKLAPAKRSKYVSKAMEQGADTVADFFADIPEGSVVPMDNVDTEDDAQDDAPRSATGVRRQFPSLRKKDNS